MNRLLFSATLAILYPVLPASLNAWQVERGAWDVTLGSDTVSVERYERTASQLTGLLLMRVPATTLLRYELSFDGSQRVTSARLQTLRPDGTPLTPARTWELRFGADSISATRTVGDSAVVSSVAARAGVMPLWHVSHQHLSWALAVEQALRQGGDSVPFQTFSPGSRSAYQTYARRAGPRLALVGYIQGARLHAHLGASGRVDSVDFGETTMRVVGRRMADVDVVALAGRFAAREASGDRMGALSPRDSMRYAATDGATMSITYGRPAARGRALFGRLLPYGVAWRLGADAATHLTTTRAIMVDGVELPAGTYTMFLTPWEGGATLIINSQTRQWGTQHNSALDIRHYPMRAETLARTVERLTFSVAPSESGGTLLIDWGTTRYSMPFRFVR